MRITSWTKKLSSALLAAGIWVPSMALAIDIPLGDASFEDAVVPSAVGYSYADTYRPTSAWVSNADMANQDTAASNWLYDAAYAESNPNRLRPAPRTGNQAMHGISHYSGQETGAVFEAGMVYKFSLWAQGDSDSTDSSSRVWMYIYDGSVPFSEPNSAHLRPLCARHRRFRQSRGRQFCGRESGHVDADHHQPPRRAGGAGNWPAGGRRVLGRRRRGGRRRIAGRRRSRTDHGNTRRAGRPAVAWPPSGLASSTKEIPAHGGPFASRQVVPF